MATKHEFYELNNYGAIRITPPGIHSGMDITLQNVSDYGDIFIGDENVTVNNYGFKLVPGAAISWSLPGLDSLYVIASTLSVNLAVLKTSALVTP